MSAAAPQLVRLAPELTAAATARAAILTLTNSSLTPIGQVKLRALLGDLTSAAWLDGYQAAHHEQSL